MLFTSITYFLFLAAALFLYYLIPRRFRSYFLTACSIWFYMYVKMSYIFLILFVIVANYFLAIQIQNSPNQKQRRGYFNFTLFINLAVLIFFKYWNFLIENLFHLFGYFQAETHAGFPYLDIVLPLGLSYYIFQTIGYTIDVYRGSFKAERNFHCFALFTLFFPKLLVGPIERARHFLPQLKREISFKKENITEGLKRIAWGLFKKLVVADRISLYHTAVITHIPQESGMTLLLASLLYTFQVYADFSGYTDIALGTARLFGYNLMENFRRPLLAKNIGEFWRRWHISLSSWVNDYVFTPAALQHRNWGNWGVYYALLISFVLIGFWHGASWNYIFFGLLQAVALIYEMASKHARKRIFKAMNKELYNNISIILTFLFVSFSLIIFQSGTLTEAASIIAGIFTKSGKLFIDKPSTLLFMVIGIAIMMLYDADEEYKIFKLSLFSNRSWVVQQISYAFLLIYILLAGVFDGGQFIYFAF